MAAIVDVILPTYGACPHLDEAIRSVVRQTYEHWRLVLVDNSPELGDAAAVLRPYLDDPRVVYFPTGGLNQADNWNAGFAQIAAPFAAMLHDDDGWDEDFLAVRVAALEAHPQCAAVFAGYRQIDGEGRFVARRPPRVSEGLHQPREFVPLLFTDNLVPVSSVLYRTSALDAVGRCFDAASSYFDYELWLRLAARFPFYCLDREDNLGRVHEGSVTTAQAVTVARRTGAMWMSFLDVVEPMLDRTLPGVVPVALRRRRRARALLTCALDSLQAGEQDDGRRHLTAAVRTDPRSLTDVRVPAILLLLAAGGRAVPWLAQVRRIQHRYGIPVHVQGIRARLQDRVRGRDRAADLRTAAGPAMAGSTPVLHSHLPDPKER